MVVIQIVNVSENAIIVFCSCKIWVLCIFRKTEMYFIELRIVPNYKQLPHPIFLKRAPICLELLF